MTTPATVETCEGCWKQDCPASITRGAACRSKHKTNLLSERGTDGTYPGLENLGSLVGTDVLQSTNLDALAGYRPAVGVGIAFSRLEAAITIDTCAIADAHLLFSIYGKRPGSRGQIEARLAVLGNTGDADDKETGRYYLTQCVALKSTAQSAEAKNKSERPQNAREFLEAKSPRRGLFVAVAKGIQQHGLTTVTHVEEIYFDPMVGRASQKVEHVVHFSCPIELLHTWNTFVTIMQRLGFGSTTGWDNMTREIYTSLKTHGVSITYDLVDQCLVKLDAKLVSNPVELVTTGALYAILHSLVSSKDSSTGDRPSNDTKVQASKQVQLGACTKQGEFASLIRNNDAGKTPRVCYNFNNGTPCKSGVNDKRHLQHKGKCAFHHVCEVCGKADGGKHAHPDCNK